MEAFGLDVGGSGVKGAPVDAATGELLAERHRVPTPEPATPEAVVGGSGPQVWDSVVKETSWL